MFNLEIIQKVENFTVCNSVLKTFKCVNGNVAYDAISVIETSDISKLPTLFTEK